MEDGDVGVVSEGYNDGVEDEKELGEEEREDEKEEGADSKNSSFFEEDFIGRSLTERVEVEGLDAVA